MLQLTGPKQVPDPQVIQSNVFAKNTSDLYCNEYFICSRKFFLCISMRYAYEILKKQWENARGFRSLLHSQDSKISKTLSGDTIPDQILELIMVFVLTEKKTSNV